jgi:hypothetical protein
VCLAITAVVAVVVVGTNFPPLVLLVEPHRQAAVQVEHLVAQWLVMESMEP